MSDVYPIQVPKWGIEMVEGTVVSWNREIGDAVAKGDAIFEMESDKIVNVWESPVDGVLRRRLVDEGDTQAVGALLGVISAADVDDSTIDSFIADFAGAATTGSDQAQQDSATPEASAAAAPAPAATAPASGSARRVSPVVRRLAAELGVDLDGVTGSGRNGRITSEDIERAAAGGSGADAAQLSDAEQEVVALTATQKTTARRLTEAKQQMPHYYLEREYHVDGLLARRAKLNESGDIRVSINDLIIWCVARALMIEPRVNVNLVGDELIRFKHANVSVAIASEQGLYPATVYKADTLSPGEIAGATAELARRASTGELTREDISGGSFTVSNLGMLGVGGFAAIINPPMAAILALGACESKVVVRDGAPAVATVVKATLSCDHRVVDGAVGASFLRALADEIAALA